VGTSSDPWSIGSCRISSSISARRHTRLLDAAHGNFDLSANIDPIRTLLDQGCDLEADVVPIVARLLSDLPRPLKNWGVPWLAREILEARDLRLGLSPKKAAR
jgi:hypothetical protein